MNVDGHLHSSEWCISMSIEGTSTDDWAVSRNIDSLMQEDDTPPFDVAICFLAPKGDLTDDIDVIELLAPHMVVIPVIAASDTVRAQTHIMFISVADARREKIPLADVQARRTRLSRDLASRAISLAPLPGYPSGIATMYAGDTAGECPSDDSRDSPIALARLITDEGLWDGSVAPQEKAREKRKAGKLKAMFGAGRANKAGIVAISLAVILAAFAIAMYSSLVRHRREKWGEA